MKKFLTPFESVSKVTQNSITLFWVLGIILFWVFNSFIGDTHRFPTISQTWDAVINLWNSGLMTHMMSTLSLSVKSVLVAVLASMVIVYLSTIPLFKPLAKIVSQMRYIPLMGLSFYLSIVITDGRSVQMSILSIFITTFLVTSMISYLKDIPQEEFDNARTLGCNRWEMLWEVVVVGRFDYIFEAIRQNLAISTMSIVSVEVLLSSSGGIGFLMNANAKMGKHAEMLALQIIILFLTLFIDVSLTLLRKRLFTYSKF